MKEYTIEHVKTLGLRIFLAGFILTSGLFGVFSYVRSNTDILDIKISVSKDRGLGLDESVVLNFSGIVFPESVDKSLSITPAVDFYSKWSNQNRTLTITPKKNWKENSVYSITINNGHGFIGKNFENIISFHTESYPKIISVNPTSGEKNVLIDIEEPISVTFDRPIDDFSIKFIVDPLENFVSQLNESKTSVQLLSQGALQKGKRYDIGVYIKHKKDPVDEYEKILDFYFSTKPEEPKNWDNDIVIRLAQAKNYTEPRILEGKYIDINLKSQVMAIFENGKILDTYMVSSGKAGMNTPEGTFKIENKALKPWSKKYSLYMPYWMAITSSGEYGIHELPEWPSGYKEGANHLGIPVSHGCVRLGVGPAKRVYEWVDVGTPVIIHQ